MTARTVFNFPARGGNKGLTHNTYDSSAVIRRARSAGPAARHCPERLGGNGRVVVATDDPKIAAAQAVGAMLPFIRLADDVFTYLSIPEKASPKASRAFEPQIVDAEWFHKFADPLRSPRHWTKESDSWTLRHQIVSPNDHAWTSSMDHFQ